MRASKKENRREQILQSAAKVFAKKGYHSTSVTDICNKADVARGTIYLYFENKRDIFDTLIKKFTHTILEGISIFSLEEPAAVQFNRNIGKIMDTVIRNKDLTKIMVSEAVGLDKEFDHQLILFYAKLVEYVEGALTLLEKNGDIPTGTDVRMLSYNIVGTIKEIAYQWAIDGGSVLDMDPLINSLRNFDIKGYIRFKGDEDNEKS